MRGTRRAGGLPFGGLAMRPRSAMIALAVVVLLVPFRADRAAGAAPSYRLDWGSKAPMPTPRAFLAVAAAPNGKLYAVGGYNSVSGGCGGRCRALEEYDPATNTWATRAPLPAARSDLALAAAPNGKLYAVGGSGSSSTCSASGNCATVEEYDPSTDTWSAKASLITPRSSAALAAAPSGKLYVVGGLGDAGVVRTVEEYDPATNGPWRQVAPMITPRRSLGLAVTNGSLYAIGGYNEVLRPAGCGGFCFTIEEYDPATDTWASRGSMPTRRMLLGLAAAANGRLYAVGGESDVCPPSGYCATVEEYDPLSNSWLTKTRMLSARTGLGLATAPNGKLYAIGGLGDAGEVGTVEEYDPAINTWATQTRAADVPDPLYLIASAVANGRMYVFGGANRSSAAVNTVYEYTPGTNAWRSVAPMPTARWGAAAALARNGRIYVVGGYNAAPGGCGGPCTAVEEFVPPTDGSGLGSWTGAPRPPLFIGIAQLVIPRQEAALALAPNGKLYVAGGFSNGNDLQRTEEYDPATNAPWRQVASMNSGRYGFGLALAGDGRLYAAGGKDTFDQPTSTVEAFTPPTDGTGLGSWAGPPHPPINPVGIAPLPGPRYEPALVSLPNGSLLAIGGTDASGTRAEVFEYDVAANGWSTENNLPTRAPLPTPRRAHAAALIGESLYAIGGTSGDVLASVQRAVLTQLPSANTGGPYTVARALAIPLSGSGADPEGGALTYAWDTNGSLLYSTDGQNPYFLSGTYPVGTVLPVRLRVSDPLGAYGLAFTTVTVTQHGCGPRPNVGVSTAKVGSGQLQATLTARTNGSTPLNNLLSVRITSIANAAVQLNGSPVSVGQTVTLPANATQATLLLTRLAPGQASTVAFVAADLCGEWKSFVGGGSGAL